jgi:hypothetical protein
VKGAIVLGLLMLAEALALLAMGWDRVGLGEPAPLPTVQTAIVIGFACLCSLLFSHRVKLALLALWRIPPPAKGNWSASGG